MPVMIRDPRVESELEQMRKRRGDKSLAKTARDLVNERLAQLEAPAPTAAPARERQQVDTSLSA
jgi:hypothetical protein